MNNIVSFKDLFDLSVRPIIVLFSYSALGCKSVLINQSVSCFHAKYIWDNDVAIHWCSMHLRLSVRPWCSLQITLPTTHTAVQADRGWPVF